MEGSFRNHQHEDQQNPTNTNAVGNIGRTITYKSSMCMQFRSGGCRYGERCLFAHSYEELLNHNLLHHHQRQRFKSNKICNYLNSRDGCPFGHRCIFRHVEPLRSQQKPVQRKTKICRQWSSTGNCSYRDDCNFAHGRAELKRIENMNTAMASSWNPVRSSETATSDKLTGCSGKHALTWKARKKIKGIYGDWIDEDEDYHDEDDRPEPQI